MPRWEPDAVGRLQNAAIDLFIEQGYDRTTVAEITERAGLSKRSFFNHFANKHEVLFGAYGELQRTTFLEAAGEAPDDVPPLDAVVLGLQAVAETLFEGRRAAVARRQQIIDTHPDLSEREAGKRALFADTIAEGLRARGLDDETALLTARAGLLVMQTAMGRWFQAAEEPSLKELLAQALLSLRGVVGGQGVV